jgi:hypothetical protein
VAKPPSAAKDQDNGSEVEFCDGLAQSILQRIFIVNLHKTARSHYQEAKTTADKKGEFVGR